MFVKTVHLIGLPNCLNGYDNWVPNTWLLMWSNILEILMIVLFFGKFINEQLQT